jgi:hypothetical protein
MSAFGGKADINGRQSNVWLLTQSGHGSLDSPYFVCPKILVVIVALQASDGSASTNESTQHS